MRWVTHPRVVAAVIVLSGLLAAVAIVLSAQALSTAAAGTDRTCAELAELRGDLVTVLETAKDRSRPDQTPMERAVSGRFYDEQIALVRPVRCP